MTKSQIIWPKLATEPKKVPKIETWQSKDELLKSVSLKIEPLQYIAMYYNGSIFNETDVKYQLW